MSWHVGVVGRRSQWVVERELALVGVAAFYPRVRRWISHARRKVAAERPLLGGYLFVEMVGAEQIARVAGIDRLQLLADIGGLPAIVADAVVFDWRQRYMRGEFDLTTREMPIGALVRIAEGEFAEQLAVVTGVARDRVTVRPRVTSRNVTMQRRNVTAA